jgi:bifunctional non-homologous end joining protein LigD
MGQKKNFWFANKLHGEAGAGGDKTASSSITAKSRAGKWKGSRKHFGALLLRAYRNGKLRYFGHSGTGFSEKGLADTTDRLKPFFTEKPSVENPPKIPEKIQWVQPKLVCEVAFAEWTEDEQLRQKTFLGWCDDENPEEVVLELQ